MKENNNENFSEEIKSFLSLSTEKKHLSDHMIDDTIKSLCYGDSDRTIQYFLSLYGLMPDLLRFSDEEYDLLKIRDYLYSLDYKVFHQEFFNYKGNTNIDCIILYNDNLKSIVLLKKSSSPGSSLKTPKLGFVYFYYDVKESKHIQEISNEIYVNYRFKQEKKNEISLIVIENRQLQLKQFEINDVDINLELNYGKSFLEVHNKLVADLNDPNGKGIAMLYSEPGCGKTTYIRNFIKLIETKKVIYVPPNLAEEISSPTFLSFLMDYPGSILIIEDAENIIKSRENTGYSSQAVQNLLNLSDGILADILKIQIVATFNTDRSNIDPALLREGRLIVEHKFTKLSIDESKKLTESLGFESNEIDKEMTLSEIYNQKNKSIRNVKKQSSIGFRTRDK